MKVLMILTSHDELGDTGEKTGFWLEEFASPYYVFKDAGAEVTLASPAGGQPPLDPKSDAEDFQTESTRRFKDDKAANSHLANTMKLADVNPADYDAVFYPGGHGPLWDLATDKHSVGIIEAMQASGKPIGAVCHAPAVFREATSRGEPFVNNKRVTGFSNSEEDAVGLTDIVPFLVEDMLKQQGGQYEKGDDWSEYVVTDGQLITGQNPASSAGAAQALLEQLQTSNSVRRSA